MAKEHGSKKARGFVGWWQHKRPTGKRAIAKSNRKNAKLALRTRKDG
jgi:hypothetical protein